MSGVLVVANIVLMGWVHELVEVTPAFDPGNHCRERWATHWR